MISLNLLIEMIVFVEIFLGLKLMMVNAPKPVLVEVYVAEKNNGLKDILMDITTTTQFGEQDCRTRMTL